MICLPKVALMAKLQVGDLVKIQGILVGRIVAIEEHPSFGNKHYVEINEDIQWVKAFPESSLERFEMTPRSSATSA